MGKMLYPKFITFENGVKTVGPREEYSHLVMEDVVYGIDGNLLLLRGAAYRQDIIPVRCGSWSFHIHNQDVDVVATILAHIKEHYVKQCQSRFSDQDESENRPQTVLPGFTTHGGRTHLYGKVGRPRLSDDCTLTGGIKYTFGCEIETAAGYIPRDALPGGVHVVGDRSIGAYEYVTPILHGNRGIKYLKRLMTKIRDYTCVDDACAFQVRVGTLGAEGVESLVYSLDFAVSLIKLCAHLEPEVFSICPPNRHPRLKYCNSIRMFKDINHDNVHEYLGAYLYGPESTWDIKTFDDYWYDPDDKQNVGYWYPGRYRWLSLIDVYAVRGAQALEFRIWPATTNFDKAYNYVLISLALVYVADFYRELIFKDVSQFDLKGVICMAYEASPSIVERLCTFIEQRKLKYAREIYAV